MSQAAADFAISFADADRLFKFYGELRQTLKPDETEVLKRAALVMAVTAFESYVEDFLQEKFPPCLEAAASPEVFKSLFETVAKKWLRENPDASFAFVEWTGDGWKKLLRSYFDQRIKALNSPKSDIVIGLFRQFLGVELSKVWNFQGYSFGDAYDRLNEIVELRGQIAHVARKGSEKPAKHPVSSSKLEKYLGFLRGIVTATESICLDGRDG